MALIVLLAASVLMTSSVSASRAAFASRCSVWPMPRDIACGGSTLRVAPEFAFASASASPLLRRAFARYEALLLLNCSGDAAAGGGAAPLPLLHGVDVRVASDSEELQVGTREDHNLTVPGGRGGGRGTIAASTVYGALHAMQSLSQLVARCELPCAPLAIADAPRFKWRGLMVDTSRHFLSAERLKQTVGAMEESKMNVLHLHLSDYQSFPLALQSLPLLAEGGAFRASNGCRSPYNPMDGGGGLNGSRCVHTMAELADLVAYAKAYIRIPAVNFLSNSLLFILK